MATTRDERRTIQKQVIRRALQEAPGFVSAQDLHRGLELAGTPVGLATVYRQLNALAESGQADTVPTPSGTAYRACGADSHHHHLICEVCGRAVELDPPDEEWIRATASRHGYTVTRHVLEIFGRCPECAAAGTDS